jgi:hypothetical protein
VAVSTGGQIRQLEPHAYRATGQIADLIEESPSLSTHPASVLAKEYARARLRAAEDTSLPLAAFPTTCPYTVEQAMNLGYKPGEPE